MNDPVNRNGKPSRSKLPLIAAGLVVLLAVIYAVQGLVRGGGEAVGVTQAAPGDDNASPASE